MSSERLSERLSERETLSRRTSFLVMKDEDDGSSDHKPWSNRSILILSFLDNNYKKTLKQEEQQQEYPFKDEDG